MMMEHDSFDALLYEGKQFLGRYTLTHKIGAGGFGQVWHATDATLGRGVAIKFLLTTPPGQTSTSADALAKQAAARKQRFVIEARVIANLKSDYAVKVYDSGESEGLSYIIMEHIDGVNLFDYLRRYRRLSSFETLLVLEQLLDVLGEAHRAGVLHRDIKPNNIMVLRTEGQIRVKLLDFGISKLTESARLASLHDMMNLTQDGGGIPGTPAYMAPEQLESGEELTPSADLFSLGLVAVEMITGDAVRQHTREVYSQRDIPLSAYGLPPFMLALLTKMVQRDPAKRYQSASQVREDIHALKEKHDLKEQDKKDALPLWEPEVSDRPQRAPELPTPRLLGAQPPSPAPHDPRLRPLDIQGMEQTELVSKSARPGPVSRNFESIVPGDLMVGALSARPAPRTTKPLGVLSPSRLRLVGLVGAFSLLGAIAVGLVHLATRPAQTSALPSEAVLASLDNPRVPLAPAPVPVPAVIPAFEQAHDKLIFAVTIARTTLDALPPAPASSSANQKPAPARPDSARKVKQGEAAVATPAQEPSSPAEVVKASTKPQTVKDASEEKPASSPPAQPDKKTDDSVPTAPKDAPVKKKRKINYDHYLDI